MSEAIIFNNINPEQLNELKACFKPVVKKFLAGETILQKSYINKDIAVLLEGKAHMYYFDIEGSTGLIEHYEKNAVFGDYFMLPIESFEYLIVADTECSVMFLDYNHIITPCKGSCQPHSRLISNIIQLTAQKVRLLTLRINIISQKSVRQKLTAYLEYQSLLNKSRSFTIPITLVDLAEYLCVDRSAIMKELHNMREEGLLESKGRKFKLLYSAENQ